MKLEKRWWVRTSGTVPGWYSTDPITVNGVSSDMERRAPAIVCTPVELGVMARLLGADTLIGLPDPFRGWTQEEIDHAIGQAQEGLLKRGYLYTQEDGKVIFDRVPALFVGACVFAETVFVVTHTPSAGEKQERYFHVNPELIVESRVDLKSEPGCRLTAWKDADAVLRRATQRLRLRNQGVAGSLSGGTIAQAALVKARSMAASGGAEQACSYLRGAGLEAEMAAALAAALARPVASGSFVGMKKTGRGWDVQGISLLEGRVGLWLLHSHPDSGQVSISPCSAEQLRGEIGSVMRATLPPGMTVSAAAG